MELFYIVIENICSTGAADDILIHIHKYDSSCYTWPWDCERACFIFIMALLLFTLSFIQVQQWWLMMPFVFFLTAGYVDLPDIFKMGLVMAFVNAIIWGVVGSFWWKFLGLYWCFISMLEKKTEVFRHIVTSILLPGQEQQYSYETAELSISS